MRTNDAPGERGALADAGDLRQRLEAMRASHPSSPEYGDRTGEPGDGEDERDMDGGPGGEAEDGTGENHEAAEGESDGLPGPDGPRSRGIPGGRGHAELGRPGPLGGSEPYRPWFSSGESLEPWFTADPPG